MLLAPGPRKGHNLPVLKRCIRVLSSLGMAAAALGLAGPARPKDTPIKPFIAYHDGSAIQFSPQVTGTHRVASLGPWNLGERLGTSSDDKPRDKRLNLYVVIPGKQYRSHAHQYDHNLVVNKYPADGKAREWDIYWCLKLDRSLNADLSSERELLQAAHQTFRPSGSFALRNVPANAVMAERLSVTKVEDLKRFRRKDGSLPRLLIVPARLAVRATAGQQYGPFPAK
jgi:hypothetical protein